MADLPALEQLRDIHLPEPVTCWPWAPGWFFLVFIALLMLFSLVWLVSRYRQRGQAKRQALQLLADYEQQYLKNRNAKQVAALLSELLRRVALVYFPREQVAGLRGDAWIDFLNRTSKGIDFNALSETLLTLPWQNRPLDVNLNPLFAGVKAWIRQRRGAPCLN